jgi:tripartite-type tricarboxylate transporter receptor subunit TctC
LTQVNVAARVFTKAALGTTPAADTPEQLSAFIASENAQWLKVARAANIKAN